jgi:hypothetical protein
VPVRAGLGKVVRSGVFLKSINDFATMRFVRWQAAEKLILGGKKAYLGR